MKHPEIKKQPFNTRLPKWFLDKMKKRGSEDYMSASEIIEKAVCKMFKWKKPNLKDLGKKDL